MVREDLLVISSSTSTSASGSFYFAHTLTNRYARRLTCSDAL